MTDAERPLLEFPTLYPLKVIGKETGDFRAFVLAIVARHVPADETGLVTDRPSGAGKYLAVTVMIRATSQVQLDAIYRDLGADPRVVMVL